MKIIIKTLILLLLTFNLYSQNLDYLKSQDTLFIALTKIENNNTERSAFKKFTYESFGNEKTNEYKFTDSIGRHIYIQTYNGNLNDINPNNKIIKRKEFLKKNKDRIITLNFIKQYYPDQLFIGYLGVTTFSLGTKVIYIIDENSLKRKDRKITLRRAYCTGVSYAQF